MEPTTTPPAAPKKPAAPDYLTPIDVYACHALNGMISSGDFPHEPASLALKAFEVAKAMIDAREGYFLANPEYVEPLPTPAAPKARPARKRTTGTGTGSAKKPAAAPAKPAAAPAAEPAEPVTPPTGAPAEASPENGAEV